MKRRMKAIPDTIRAASGYVTRQWEALPWEADILGKATGFEFRDYASLQPNVKIRTATPGDGHYMTTFFDVNPFSPSGRYLAVTRVPFINRIPIPGDKALVCVIDLLEGRCVPVYETTGWGAQLGANVQWGRTDEVIFCNDVIDGRPAGIKVNVGTGDCQVLEGTVYGVDAEAKYSYSADLQLINALIPGYGVPENPFNIVRQKHQLSETDGLWRTDLESGKRVLLAPTKDIVQSLDEPDFVRAGTHYLFNVKVNKNNSRILLVTFCRGTPGRVGPVVQLVTTDINGRDPRLAMPDRLWRKGGHHPNWTPDGDHILMNLRQDGEMGLVTFRWDGTNLTRLAAPTKGSGHPTLHPSGRYVLTDSYVSEGFKYSDNNVPLRWIDVERGTETHLCTIHTKNLDGPRRIDPHPAWSRDYMQIAFNGIVDGRRQVMIAGLEGIL